MAITLVHPRQIAPAGASVGDALIWDGAKYSPAPLPGGGGDPVLGGDLGGVASDGHVKTVRGVSSSLTYDGNGRLSTVTTALGTKTMTYSPDGTLASITGTGRYRNKAFTYSGGKLSAVAVS